MVEAELPATTEETVEEGIDQLREVREGLYVFRGIPVVRYMPVAASFEVEGDV